MVLFGTRGPQLFWVVREGLGSGVRLCARGTQRLTYQLRLALEPECLKNPANHRQKRSQGMERIARNTQAVCGFKYLASKRTPFFQTVKVMAAILRASVSRAISGLMPLATSAS
jgi:hypothetical protein